MTNKEKLLELLDSKELHRDGVFLPDVAEHLDKNGVIATKLDFKDVLNNAEHLFSMHPAPWGFYARGIDGYVVDANGSWIFGGEECEGYVDEDDKEIAALVDVINSLWRYMKGEKCHTQTK